MCQPFAFFASNFSIRRSSFSSFASNLACEEAIACQPSLCRTPRVYSLRRLDHLEISLQPESPCAWLSAQLAAFFFPSDPSVHWWATASSVQLLHELLLLEYEQVFKSRWVKLCVRRLQHLQIGPWFACQPRRILAP